jgi:hypothetical protein
MLVGHGVSRQCTGKHKHAHPYTPNTTAVGKTTLYSLSSGPPARLFVFKRRYNCGVRIGRNKSGNEIDGKKENKEYIRI